MADQPIYDSELLETLQDWWQRYGRNLVVLVAVAAVGVGVWQWRERALSVAMRAASDDYEALVVQLAEWDDRPISAGAGQAVPERQELAQQLMVAADTISEHYPDSHYAHYAQSIKARLLIEGGDLEGALQLLEALALRLPADSDLQELLVMRRARILEALGHPAAAERLLRTSPQLIYPQEYQLLLGDLLRRQGHPKAAMQAYASAVELYRGQQRGENIPVSLRLHLESLSSTLATLQLAEAASSTGIPGIDIDAPLQLLTEEPDEQP